jgi:predicted amidohydrolase
MRIALAQMNSAPGDLGANLQRHLDRIQAAIDAGADLVVFPELSLAGDFQDDLDSNLALSMDSHDLQEIAAASREIDIVAGFVERGRIRRYKRYNSAAYFSEGDLAHRHRKLFLVDYAIFEESRRYAPGESMSSFDTAFARNCLLLCNDVWHTPAPYLAAVDGAEILLVPANSARGALESHLDIPGTWERLNRTVSATLGMFTIFVNRVGVREDSHGRFQYWGGSEIIDPRGETLLKAPYDEEALVVGEVDVSLVRAQREAAPIIRDTRLAFLRREIRRLTVRQAEAIRVADDDIDSMGFGPASPEQVRAE